jgi:hypothetical protein
MDADGFSTLHSIARALLPERSRDGGLSARRHRAAMPHGYLPLCGVFVWLIYSCIRSTTTPRGKHTHVIVL